MKETREYYEEQIELVLNNWTIDSGVALQSEMLIDLMEQLDDIKKELKKLNKN